MSKELLQEYFELCPEGRCPVHVLTEAEKRSVMEGAVYLVGIIQKAGTKNGNGRIYRKETLQREIENYQKAVNERRSLGELDHPDDSVINLKNASHQLICFDMVSEPSTPGAYLAPSQGNTKMNMDPAINVYLNEGKEDKIDDLIQSILKD